MKLETLVEMLNAFPEDTNYANLTIVQTDTYKAKVVLRMDDVDIALGRLDFEPLPKDD